MKKLLILSITTLFLLVAAGWTQQAAAQDELPSELKDVDHYKCYNVKGKALDPKPAPIVNDEFELDRDLVGKPVMLCNPADKNGEGILEPKTHLVCYEIKGRRKLPSGLRLSVDNQFTLEQILKTSKTENLLCVPSTKECINDLGESIRCPNQIPDF